MHYTKIIVLIIAFIFGLSAARSQTDSAATKVQSTAPSNERTKIGFLSGTFATEINIPVSRSMPKGGTAKGTSRIVWDADSMFLSIEDTSTLLGGYKARGVLACDVKTHQFVLSLTNNFGDRPMYFGNFVGDTLVLQTKIQSPSGAFDQKILWYKDNNVVRMKIFNDLGKGFLLTLEQTATAVSQKVK